MLATQTEAGNAARCVQSDMICEHGVSCSHWGPQVADSYQTTPADTKPFF